MLFGDKGTKSARIASWLSPLIRSRLVDPALMITPTGLSEQVKWLRTIARQQRRQIEHPNSFPIQFVTYTQPELVGSLLSDELVAERCRKQLDYVRDRLVTTAPAGFPRQMEMAFMTSLFGLRVGNRWRQLAIAHGNSLLEPFKTRSATECALSVPARERYINYAGRPYDLTKKAIPKRLLSQRLPSYPIDQKKGAGVLPIERYLSDGPLSDIFDDYPIPSFVPDSLQTTTVEKIGPQMWNLVTYAMWQRRVLETDDVSRLEYRVLQVDRLVSRTNLLIC